MARISARPEPRRERTLQTVRRRCPGCGRRMGSDDANRRTVVTLTGVVRLRLKVRRCPNPACGRQGVPYRPEAEGALVLPRHEFGLDGVALIGALRYREHRSVPEIRRALRGRGVALAERTVTNLLDRYDELLAVALADDRRLRTAVAGQGRVILGLDGLQPDGGHEVLWVARDGLSGEILLAESLLSATADDLAALLRRVADGVGVPVAGVVSDGQHSIRRAVARALPGVPHQLCPFHDLREAAHPVFAADRHAKKELKKHVRGVRPIERAVEGRDDAEARAVRGYGAAVRGYGAAVRSALTDDGRPHRSPPRACGCATGSRRWRPASSAWRKRGADASVAAAAAAAADRGRPGAHP